MTDVTNILGRIEDGDPSAAEKLLPLVYEELRKLATARMAEERPDHTLQATALVHDAYIRLVDIDKIQHWNSRGHFFAAAAEAMRRILVEQARRKKSLKAGGDRERINLAEVVIPEVKRFPDLLALDAALEKLEHQSPRKAELVKLRFFAGLTIEQVAKALGISASTANADWVYAKGWLRLEMQSND
jgi:RNA polymerase sigma factor (TIGR02999 family)